MASPMCLNLNVGVGKVTISTSMCAVLILSPLKHKAVDDCKPCFYRPLCMYSLSPCVLHMHRESAGAEPYELCESVQPMSSQSVVSWKAPCAHSSLSEAAKPLRLSEYVFAWHQPVPQQLPFSLVRERAMDNFLSARLLKWYSQKKIIGQKKQQEDLQQHTQAQAQQCRPQLKSDDDLSLFLLKSFCVLGKIKIVPFWVLKYTLRCLNTLK